MTHATTRAPTTIKTHTFRKNRIWSRGSSLKYKANRIEVHRANTSMFRK